ncbi:MAG: LysM peptidoglycan-binding domain-containing protein [Victivallales bacterium]
MRSGTAKATRAVTGSKRAGKKKAENKKTTGKKGAGKTEKATVPADGVVIVKEGDSFSRIAARMPYCQSRGYQSRQGGKSSNRLQIGQKLNLPTGKTCTVACKQGKGKSSGTGGKESASGQ